MNRASIHSLRIAAAALLMVCVSTLAPVHAESGPRLAITQIPTFKQRYAYLRGTVSGVNVADYYVAAFIMIPGRGWYSKPYCSEAGRVVPINPDGTWSVYTYTGGDGSMDNLCTMVEAYLIPKSSYPACYPSCTADAKCVPESVVAASAASDRALCPGQRTISWSGYDWHVRTSQGGGNIGQVMHVGNYFFDSTDNVWVDAQGKLHIKITYANGRWNCAWLASADRLGYGTYRFYCDSRLDNLDKYVTLGLFAWSDFACVTGNREIDFEFSTWGDSILPNNAQYVIQPYWVSGNILRYPMTSAATSTHTFTWKPGSVSFNSVEGHCVPPATCTQIKQWEFTRSEGVPASADERVNLNLWLNNSTYEAVPGPSSGQPVEVVISRFEFIPYRDPQRPLVGANSRAFADSVTGTAAATHSFKLWGRIDSKDTGGFLLSDGGPAHTRILDPGHTFLNGSFVAAEGIVAGTAPRNLDTGPGRITLME